LIVGYDTYTVVRPCLRRSPFRYRNIFRRRRRQACFRSVEIENQLLGPASCPSLFCLALSYGRQITAARFLLSRDYSTRAILTVQRARVKCLAHILDQAVIRIALYFFARYRLKRIVLQDDCAAFAGHASRRILLQVLRLSRDGGFGAGIGWERHTRVSSHEHGNKQKLKS